MKAIQKVAIVTNMQILSIVLFILNLSLNAKIAIFLPSFYTKQLKSNIYEYMHLNICKDTMEK